MTTFEWLPALVEFDGNWNNFHAYENRVYEAFLDDFVRRRPLMFYGVRVTLRRHPEYQCKSASFWHLVTEGKIEENRSPVVERCERIRWPRAILERASVEKDLPSWRSQRGREVRVLVALADFSYVVVLDKRTPPGADQYLLLLTAFPVEAEHRRAKLAREHDEWMRESAKTSPQKG